MPTRSIRPTLRHSIQFNSIHQRVQSSLIPSLIQPSLTLSLIQPSLTSPSFSQRPNVHTDVEFLPDHEASRRWSSCWFSKWRSNRHCVSRGKRRSRHAQIVDQRTCSPNSRGRRPQTAGRTRRNWDLGGSRWPGCSSSWEPSTLLSPALPPPPARGRIPEVPGPRWAPGRRDSSAPRHCDRAPMLGKTQSADQRDEGERRERRRWC
jgi:hypothetical protein